MSIEDATDEFISALAHSIERPPELDESNVKMKIVEPLVRFLGWHTHRNDEVLREFSRADRAIARLADYALLDPAGNVACVIEVKPQAHTVEQAIPQTREYMRLFGATYGLAVAGVDATLYETTTTSPPDEAVLAADSLTNTAFLQTLAETISRSVMYGGDAPEMGAPQQAEELPFPPEILNLSRQHKAAYTAIEELDRPSLEECYTAYCTEMEEEARSKRMFSSYISDLVSEGVVQRLGPKQDRQFTPR